MVGGDWIDGIKSRRGTTYQRWRNVSFLQQVAVFIKVLNKNKFGVTEKLHIGI